MRICFTKIVPLFFLLYCGLVAIPIKAQSKIAGEKKRPTGEANAITLGINAPLGDFSNTHILGFGAEYSRSNHRFGLMKAKPFKLFDFIYTAGADHYFGKKEKTSTYIYDYPGFTQIHTYAGVIYNPCKIGNASLTAGPALGIYNSRTEFWWGVNLNGHYYFTKKIGIAPGISFMKQHGADAIWSATLRAVMAF